MSEFRLSTQVDIPIIGSNTAPFDGYPTCCPPNAENTCSAACSSSTAPPYLGPDLLPLHQDRSGCHRGVHGRRQRRRKRRRRVTVKICGSGFTGAHHRRLRVDAGHVVHRRSATSIITAVIPARYGRYGGHHRVTTKGPPRPRRRPTKSPTARALPDAPTGHLGCRVTGTPSVGAATGSCYPASARAGRDRILGDRHRRHERRPNGGQTCSPDPGDSCSLSGLTDGDSYTFAVTATNAIGTSDGRRAR